ncbi:unnamed protein product [Adineta ricciae]|uniref:Uncharacterized protein n=1 Tax=Adineta ricciae TaxID=249248 RepID=A0A814ASV8_ADIRI|nr:unnamed protein product [Adineta ricciae]
MSQWTIMLAEFRYERELDPAYWTTVRKGVVYGTYVGWFSLIYHLVYVSGFIIGSVLMTSTTGHVTTIDHILVIVMLFAECIQLLGYIGPCFQSFSEGREAAVSVFNLIEKGQDATVIEHDLLNENQFTGDTTLDFIDDIEFDHVNFMYPSRKEIMVLNNLNVIFRANRKTALVGPSGCGKSTCISLLLGYYEPSSGRINIGSRSLTEYGIKQFRQNIGVVSQEAIVFSMSIYDNIRLGKRNATRDEIEAAAREANAHKFIMKLPDKYETSIGESGVQLSGGEKQRIVLARALVKQPKVLLLDEATSALDNINEKIVQEALDRASKSELYKFFVDYLIEVILSSDRTTIVIAHRLTTIQNADYIYVFDEGRVIEEGTHKTLMTKQDGRYQSMVRTQQTIKRNEEERDDLLNTETIIAEKEKQIVFESGALSEGQFVYRNQRKDLTLSNRKSIFLRLLAMNASEWVTILVGCIACILIGLTQPMFALMLTNIINAFKNCGSTDIRYRVSVASLLFILLGVISTFIFLFQYTAFAIVGSKLVQRIRSKAFACLLRQEIAYFDEVENSSGSICARLASNATALQDMTGTRWRLTIVLFVPIFILSIMMYVTIQANRLLRAKTDIYYNRANSVAVEFIHNMRTIKLLSAENEALRQYTELIQQIFKASLKSSFVNAMTVGVSWALDSFTIAILYWRTVVLVENNQIALDDIITVFAFVTFTLQISKIFGMLSTRIGASISAAYTFFDLFDRIPNIDNASRQGQEQSNFCGKIDFDKVKFAYPTRPTTIVLNKFQWNIKPGQRVALVGASGCGKSTIIQLLQRFYDVTEGQLFINGVDIQELNIQWLRSQLGLVSQEPSLFDLTIAENIAYGLENVPEEAIVNAAIKANIDQLIRQLPQGYQTKVGVKGTFMSGGEKQRIALARVFLRQPKILLLDEITSALDPHNEQIIQQAINQTQEDDPSRTLITIAHRLSTIHSYDSIHVIDQGRIVESGTHTELIQKHGIYYEMLFSTQNGFA